MVSKGMQQMAKAKGLMADPPIGPRGFLLSELEIASTLLAESDGFCPALLQAMALRSGRVRLRQPAPPFESESLRGRASAAPSDSVHAAAEYGGRRNSRTTSQLGA